MPPSTSHTRGGALPSRASGVTVLVTSERELAVDREPGRARGQRVERAGRVHHRVLELERADARREIGAHAADPLAGDDRALDAEPHAARPPRRTAQP